MEFHISRRSREKFQFDQTLFALDGNVLFADLYSVRLFANKINEQRDLARFPEQAAHAGQINALGLMDEIFHYVFFLYRQQIDPKIIEKAMTFVESESGDKVSLDNILALFIKEFPPSSVFRQEISAEEYLGSDTKGTHNHQLVLEELILYWVTVHNPALNQYEELFDSPLLTEERGFQTVFDDLQKFFADQPAFGPENQTLLTLMMSPAKAVPHSLTGQLEYIREHWASFLGEYFYRLLTSLDLLKEENKLTFGGGPGPVPVPAYDRQSLLAAGGSMADRVAFSQDRSWMPGLVLMAKNSFVWLDQLSKKYGQTITSLDQIPENELVALAQAGVTGLWLIGLWERSKASARIKQLCGNPEAIASAYSLYSYEIASDLGGYAAYERLRDKARQYGIFLASDMVPNHMGIDSEWVLHHPERFLSVDHCPYPNYEFNGPDLSTDPNVTVQIEDHYYSRTDAAVVFKRYEHSSGRTQYIYHGNDGTSMPWNDTAQLNYLSKEVQETVYQTILQVARMFPIIRFDAAMTLAKKQVQRLWFPEPGTGGAIPSRSEYSMTREQFEAAMPDEFWRMVVDRIAVDAPDTLLLAEAFWMMEGYFVRSLGMHRVYNSAFMHMLRDENNAGYRQLIKNTLEFEPEILKRYVNFMNNPDERTAVDQFGKGDKYFGVCTLMATFPGLPMLGHGQIEGFAEKYGMEYKHAYLEESVDEPLVQRHRKEIFPLLQKRKLFSGVENFWLFDFFTSSGHVNENVFAFTNSLGNDRALVIVNNNMHSSEGWLKTSSARLPSNNSSGKTEQRSLSDCLGVNHSDQGYLLYRDQSSGLQFIRKVDTIKKDGFHIHLNGYEYHVFYDFKLVNSDSKHDYRRLIEYLGEGGIPDIETGMTELFMQPVLQPYREVVNSGYFKYLGNLFDQGITHIPDNVLLEAENKMGAFLSGIETALKQPLTDKESAVSFALSSLKAVLTIPDIVDKASASQMTKTMQAAEFISKNIDKPSLYTLITWSFISQIGRARIKSDDGLLSLAWMDEWQLMKPFKETLKELGFSDEIVNNREKAIRLLTNQQDWFEKLGTKTAREIARTWFSTPEIQSFIQVNRFEDVVWYNSEAMKDFIWWMEVSALIHCQQKSGCSRSQLAETLLESHKILQKIALADKNSHYQLEKLLDNIEE